MRQKFLILFIVCIALFASACFNSSSNNAANANKQAISPNLENKASQATNVSPNQTSDNKIAPSQILNVSVAQANIKAGGSTEAVVTAKIADGYHINANPPSEPAFIPTVIEIKPSNGVTADKATYPPAITRKLSFSDKPLAVYENQAVIKVKLKAASNATKGTQMALGTIRYQACDNEVCYPPTKLDLMIPLNIN